MDILRECGSVLVRLRSRNLSFKNWNKVKEDRVTITGSAIGRSFGNTSLFTTRLIDGVSKASKEGLLKLLGSSSDTIQKSEVFQNEWIGNDPYASAVGSFSRMGQQYQGRLSSMRLAESANALLTMAHNLDQSERTSELDLLLTLGDALQSQENDSEKLSKFVNGVLSGEGDQLFFSVMRDLTQMANEKVVREELFEPNLFACMGRYMGEGFSDELSLDEIVVDLKFLSDFVDDTIDFGVMTIDPKQVLSVIEKTLSQADNAATLNTLSLKVYLNLHGMDAQKDDVKTSVDLASAGMGVIGDASKKEWKKGASVDFTEHYLSNSEAYQSIADHICTVTYSRYNVTHTEVDLSVRKYISNILRSNKDLLDKIKDEGQIRWKYDASEGKYYIQFGDWKDNVVELLLVEYPEQKELGMVVYSIGARRKTRNLGYDNIIIRKISMVPQSFELLEGDDHVHHQLPIQELRLIGDVEFKMEDFVSERSVLSRMVVKHLRDQHNIRMQSIAIARSLAIYRNKLIEEVSPLFTNPLGYAFAIAHGGTLWIKIRLTNDKIFSYPLGMYYNDYDTTRPTFMIALKRPHELESDFKRSETEAEKSVPVALPAQPDEKMSSSTEGNLLYHKSDSRFLTAAQELHDLLRGNALLNDSDDVSIASLQQTIRTFVDGMKRFYSEKSVSLQREMVADDVECQKSINGAKELASGWSSTYFRRVGIQKGKNDQDTPFIEFRHHEGRIFRQQIDVDRSGERASVIIGREITSYKSTSKSVTSHQNTYSGAVVSSDGEVLIQIQDEIKRFVSIQDAKDRLKRFLDLRKIFTGGSIGNDIMKYLDQIYLDAYGKQSSQELFQEVKQARWRIDGGRVQFEVKLHNSEYVTIPLRFYVLSRDLRDVLIANAGLGDQNVHAEIGTNDFYYKCFDELRENSVQSVVPVEQWFNMSLPAIDDDYYLFNSNEKNRLLFSSHDRETELKSFDEAVAILEKHFKDVARNQLILPRSLNQVLKDYLRDVALQTTEKAVSNTRISNAAYKAERSEESYKEYLRVQEYAEKQKIWADRILSLDFVVSHRYVEPGTIELKFRLNNEDGIFHRMYLNVFIMDVNHGEGEFKDRYQYRGEYVCHNVSGTFEGDDREQPLPVEENGTAYRDEIHCLPEMEIESSEFCPVPAFTREFSTYLQSAGYEITSQDVMAMLEAKLSIEGLLMQDNTMMRLGIKNGVVALEIQTPNWSEHKTYFFTLVEVTKVVSGREISYFDLSPFTFKGTHRNW
ncbi:MAG: hypothetical protein ABIE74_13125 [Pseudomonadota bacterium]